MNDAYATELRRRHARSSKAPRINLSAPVKSAAPFVLRKANVPVQIEARTFFNRPMKVVLPEMVSVAIWRSGFFEEDVCAYLLQVLRPGDVFIDIGGHFGFFSMLARELVGAQGTVATFEPMPGTRKILMENMERNAAPAYHHLIPAAAGAAAARLTFKDYGLVGSAFATSAAGRNGSLQHVGDVDVDVRTVDSVTEELGLTSLRLMKIDAEDAEYDVLMGSLDTIRKLRPAIILEAGDVTEGATRRAMDVLLAEGYEPYEFADWSLRRHAVSENYTYQNLLMVPLEKSADMVTSK
jgi:FkbM family methyltransferase